MGLVLIYFHIELFHNPRVRRKVAIQERHTSGCKIKIFIIIYQCILSFSPKTYSSICGHDIDSFDCHHIKGELYDGEIAIGIVQKISKFDHCALVENPENKRCVVGVDDNHPGMLVLKELGQYVVQGKLKPLGFNKVIKIEFDKPNESYVALKPNQKCFCGSGVKFKKCCRDKKTLRHAHYAFSGTSLNLQSPKFTF